MIIRFRNKKSNDETTSARRRVGNNAHRFNRNRAIIGSKSDSVASIADETAERGNNSPRTHVHHLSRNRRHIARWLAVVIVIVCVLMWVLYQFISNVRIGSLLGQDGSMISTSKYQQVINDYLGKHPTQRLRIFLDKSQLDSYMQQRTPEVAGLQNITAAGGLGSTEFVLTFRHPVVSWIINGKTYFVDKNGVLFNIDYFGAPPVNVIDKGMVSGTDSQTVASSSLLQFIGSAVDVANQFGVSVTEVVIPKQTVHEIDLKIKHHPYIVKLSTDRPIGDQIEDMQRSITYLKKHKITPKYVDVRIPGRAYYK